MDFESSVRKEWHELTLKLMEKDLSVSTMESCTGGQIASLLTDTDGASKIVKGAFITYCDEAKVLQGVNKKTIENYGVYSKETALEMALSCKKTYGADIGIGVTGIMTTKKEGKVYFAVVTDNKNEAVKITIPEADSRLFYKLYTADKILKVITKIIY